jgi:predicted transposase YdaD
MRRCTRSTQFAAVTLSVFEFTSLELTNTTNVIVVSAFRRICQMIFKRNFDCQGTLLKFNRFYRESLANDSRGAMFKQQRDNSGPT